ncbi:MAG: RNA-guided pseudouridylation complex pseudouridine synthase subunit Cbf5 [Nanoarchaeota archaeon]|nr:RNA-guided pseudouridylation complex pseudouridine synthase subunit Cbf5 [Nanoarchaeota archaeon]
MIEKKPLKQLLEFSMINIDKPSDPTSFDISDFVRKKLSELGIRKTSHFGTLDPKVTGVLPIALNRACKLTGFFLGEDKEYIGVMRIHEDLPIEKIKKVIEEKFLGKIKQTPPVKSRVKRQEREREIKSFNLLEKDGKDILFHAEVQGGTYIRKLMDDLGKELGIGAHMLELRRVRAGIFKENDKKYPCVDWYEFEKAVEEYRKGHEEALRKILIPAEEAIKQLFSCVQVKEESVKKLLTGKPLFEEDLKEGVEIKNDKFAVFSGEKFVGIYHKVNEREIIAKPEFVLQEIKN